jgi:hypothetical protein
MNDLSGEQVNGTAATEPLGEAREVTTAEAEPPQTPRGVTIEDVCLSPRPPEGGSWDVRSIEEGITAALPEGRFDDRTAHDSAAQLNVGYDTDLYSPASTGHVRQNH